MNNKNRITRVSVRKEIHKKSFKLIGIRVNEHVDWVNHVASYCRLSILPVIEEMMDEFAEVLNYNESIMEFLPKAIVSGSLAHAYLHKALYDKFPCDLPSEDWTITDENLWFDEELQNQLLAENHDCGFTMVIIDLQTYTVKIL